MAVTKGVPKSVEPLKSAEEEAAEEKKLAVMMIPKKRRHLYERIMHSKKQEQKEINKLHEKRKAIETQTVETSKKKVKRDE